MYTYTPTHKFLVLAPIQCGPTLALPQTENLPASSQVRERSSSQSSTASSGTQMSERYGQLPSGFLYLGHDTPTTSNA